MINKKLKKKRAFALFLLVIILVGLLLGLLRLRLFHGFPGLFRDLLGRGGDGCRGGEYHVLLAEAVVIGLPGQPL